MKTIGTIINTIVVVFGMLCSLIAGAFVGYSIAKDEKLKYKNTRAYTTYRNVYDYNIEYNKGYASGWNDCKEAYNFDNYKEEESEKNENIGEA